MTVAELRARLHETPADRLARQAAVQEGRRAWAAGITVNPYPSHSPLYAAWAEGWRSSYQEHS